MVAEEGSIHHIWQRRKGRRTFNMKEKVNCGAVLCFTTDFLCSHSPTQETLGWQSQLWPLLPTCLAFACCSEFWSEARSHLYHSNHRATSKQIIVKTSYPGTALKAAFAILFLVSSFVCILPSYQSHLSCVFSFQLLFGGSIILSVAWFFLHTALFFFLSYPFMLACLISEFAVSLSPVSFQLFFLSAAFSLSVSSFPLPSSSYFCSTDHLRLSISYHLPTAPVPFLPVSFSLLPTHPLPTHTSERDTAWVHQGRTELVPNWQGIGCFMCVIGNANAQEQWLFSQFSCGRLYEEHQTPLWSFRSRPFWTEITWVDKGIPKANHSPSSLLRTLLFSRRWKFNRKAICKHFSSGDLSNCMLTFCTTTVEQLSCYVLFSPFAYLKCFLKWEKKKVWPWQNMAFQVQKTFEECCSIPSVWGRLEQSTGVQGALTRLGRKALFQVFYLPK